MPRLVVVALCRATIATVAIALLSGCIDTRVATTPTSQTQSPATATSRIGPTPSPAGRAHPITELADHVLPAPGGAVSDKDTELSIVFREPMDPSSFGPGTMEIVEAKYSRDVAGLFSLSYRTDLKTLLIEPQSREFRWGTGDRMEVILHPPIRYSDGRVLIENYEWTFDSP
jgi:hypothetical protein